MEGALVVLQHVAQIRVIPAIVDHLNDDRVRNVVLPHQIEQHLRRRVFRGRILGLLGERIAAVVTPDVHVGIDDPKLVALLPFHERRRTGGSHETSSAQHLLSYGSAKATNSSAYPSLYLLPPPAA